MLPNLIPETPTRPATEREAAESCVLVTLIHADDSKADEGEALAALQRVAGACWG